MRPLQRLRRLVRGPIGLWFHPAFRLPYSGAQLIPGFSNRRAEDALTWALDRGIVDDAEVHEARELSWDDAALVHHRDYLEQLDRPEVAARILGLEPERIAVPELLETWRRGAGATVDAARWARRHGGRAINPMGGFHHAEPTRGGGFCAINDVGVAVARLRLDGFDGRILVIDLDAHPPDGIVACLPDDPELEVRTLSTRSEWTIPAVRRTVVRDHRVPPGTTDDAYLAAVGELLVNLPDAELVFYVAGADPLAGDPLGGLGVSEDGLRERDRRVFAAVGRIPTVALSAGGYLETSWRVLAGTIAEAAGRRRVRVAPGYDPVLRRTRDVMKRLDPSTLRGEPDALITEADVFGSLGIRPADAEPRFLGYYTRHGLEHALGAYGYLDALRRLGFDDLRVVVETGQGPDRMKVEAPVKGKVEILVDLAASIRRLDRFRVLFVEWLELRDPRVPFTPSRPRLPGQQQPGLGLSEETGQLLVRAAERLELDGVSFVPAHYHVAWMSRGRFVIVDPEARGRFRALQRWLGDLPLLEATRLLGGPGLPTEDGERVHWQPVEMVAPLRPELAEFLTQGESRARMADQGLFDRLLPRASVLPG